MRRPRRLGRRERGFARVYGGYLLGHFGVFASPMRAGYGGHAVYFGGNQQGLFRRQIACLRGRPSTRTGTAASRYTSAGTSRGCFVGKSHAYRGGLQRAPMAVGGGPTAWFVGNAPAYGGASAVCFYSVSSSKHMRTG